jgi:hypothetical protein
MNIRTACAALLLSLPALDRGPAAANLQTQDLLFFSTHKFPSKVVGDDKNSYVLTESGVLVYDLRRMAWVDNLAVGARIRDIRYSERLSRLYAMTEGGRFLEYNPAFRRFTDASESDFSSAAGGNGRVPDLTGLNLEGEWFFLGDAVRDRYMRRAPIASARVFDYDNLWVLTSGLGPFLGSERRKRAAPAWFGLDDPACFTIHPEGRDIWFGTCRPDGALVRSSADLSEWKVHPSNKEFGFGDGCVRDVRVWKGLVWLATDKGVVRHDPATGRFQTFSHMQGSTNLPVHALHVHQGLLHAANEEGVSYLEDPKGDFKSLPMPGNVRYAVYELESKGKDLWAATRFGLYVHRPGKGWASLKDVTGKDVPESYGQLVPSVRHHDTTLYWLSGHKVMRKPRGSQGSVLLERDRPFRLRIDGHFLYVAFHGGVTAFDLRRNLWTDFRLEDGIPGDRVLSMALSPGHLWIGTDKGVARIKAGPYLP